MNSNLLISVKGLTLAAVCLAQFGCALPGTLTEKRFTRQYASEMCDRAFDCDEPGAESTFGSEGECRSERRDEMLQALVPQIEETAVLVANISESTKQQNIGIAQINDSILDLGEEVAIRLSLRLELSENTVTRNGMTFRTGSAGMDMETEASIGGFSRVWDLLLPEGENFVILGRSTMVTDRDTREFDTDVREILVPGDPGFASHQGRFDCGEEL